MNKFRKFIPPFIWSKLSKARAKISPRPPKGLMEIVTGDDFILSFQRVEHERGIYFVPGYAEHRPACQAILSGAVYEPATHDAVNSIMQVRPGSMIHAGTFFGDMLPTFAKYCPGTVYAFEPVLENYVLSKLCVEYNQLDNIHLQNAALSSETAIARISTGHAGGMHRGGSSQLSNTGQIVGLVTIDSLGLDDVSVIQLDVEGHEYPALLGADFTISTCKPVILIEDNNRACDKFLEYRDYVQVGIIPGLRVWACRNDVEWMRGLIAP